MIDPLQLSKSHPEMSAKEPLTRAQKRVIIGLAIGIVVSIVATPILALKTIVAIVSVFYLFITLYKFVIIASSIRSNSILRFTSDEINPTPDRDWPIFSVLVPLYNEPDVVPSLVSNLEKIDYPSDRKDIQLLLEGDDTATLAAVAAISKLPQGIRVTRIPPSMPRTKPKACNVGLEFARGEYLVIYDAEDRPEPDQLRKAVLAFEKSGPMTACVQSSLNFYNSGFNWLTKFFTGDYSAWFDLQLPGLAASKAVIPLGGTSNHFQTRVLRELQGWDAYNVTEDCDLGVRLCRAGYRTVMLDTTTWEEACSSLPFWIRQRTRWIKGYIQTYFVHSRNPITLMHDLGFRNFIHFQMLVGGVCFSALVNPIFWIMALLWFTIKPTGLDALFPLPVFVVGMFCLFVGNFVFLYISLLGCFKRGYDRILFFNIFTPFYWMLMSVSGWRALFQFFRNPFLWEKTQHAKKGTAK